MQKSQIPVKFVEAFAALANASYIVEPVQLHPSAPGGADGITSLDLGFPPITDVPVGSGGKPPRIQDFNGVLNQVTGWLWWLAGGGGIPAYDATFSTAVGGYPSGAILQSALTPGLLFVSTADNNTNNPDTTPTNWTAFGGSGAQTGDWKWRPTSENLLTSQGGYWAKANGTTVGNGSSNASQFANALAANLFAWTWTNFSNAQCPLLNSSGSPISRGATAAADFAANNAITLIDMRGIGIRGLDNMGTSAAGRFPSAIPFTNVLASGSATTPGSVPGEDAHTMTINDLVPHTHTYQGNTNPQGIQTGGGGDAANWPQSALNSGSTGGGLPFNVMSLDMLGTHYLKA